MKRPVLLFAAQFWLAAATVFAAAAPDRSSPAVRAPATAELPAQVAWIALFAETVKRNRQGLWEAKLNGGIEVVHVPTGIFLMGSPRTEAGREADEGPLHRVRLTGVWIGKTEVTRAQWHAVMGGGAPSVAERELPQGNVSWLDAQAFLQALRKRSTLPFRLPTEAEWECCCRGGSFASQYGPLDRIAWHAGNANDRPHPVGTRAANGYGLFDMLGNVWEWCSDWYGENYYVNSPYMDPAGPAQGKRRVVRGGGFRHGGTYLRCAHRNDNAPATRMAHLGLRLALDAALAEG